MHVNACQIFAQSVLHCIAKPPDEQGQTMLFLWLLHICFLPYDDKKAI